MWRAPWVLSGRRRIWVRLLAYWGVGSGPYLVLPILGPSNLRDLGGRIGDRPPEPSQLARRGGSDRIHGRRRDTDTGAIADGAQVGW